MIKSNNPHLAGGEIIIFTAFIVISVIQLIPTQHGGGGHSEAEHHQGIFMDFPLV